MYIIGEKTVYKVQKNSTSKALALHKSLCLAQWSKSVPPKVYIKWFKRMWWVLALSMNYISKIYAHFVLLIPLSFYKYILRSLAEDNLKLESNQLMNTFSKYFILSWSAKVFPQIFLPSCLYTLLGEKWDQINYY